MSESHQAETPAVRSNRDFLKVWGPAVIITVAGFVAAWQFVDPAPPNSLRIASGNSEGAYYQHATRYRELLAEQGITLEVIETAGSVDNLERLQAGACDLGFVQGGTASVEAIHSLESLASLYFEPLWVFHREGFQLEQLADLEGQRIAIGEAGSGTQLLGRKLLADNGIAGGSAQLRPLASKAAAEQLQAGQPKRSTLRELSFRARSTRARYQSSGGSDELSSPSRLPNAVPLSVERDFRRRRDRFGPQHPQAGHQTVGARSDAGGG